MDSKALPLFKSAVKKLTDCYREQFPQTKIVYFDDAFPVFWADISLLRVICGLFPSDRLGNYPNIGFRVLEVEIGFIEMIDEQGFSSSFCYYLMIL